MKNIVYSSSRLAALCKRVALPMLALCFAMQATAQTTQISGTVTDASGPMSGVSVTVKGTTIGALTDNNGRYTISAPANATLTFSFMGYAGQEQAVNGRTTIDVTLSESAENLEEVVVVGYGTMRKKDLTGSIAQVRPDQLANENPTTVQDVLRTIPGLQVGYDPSAKGGGSMSIRGQRSVYTDGGHNEPLLILDGMMFYGELSEINPDDIAQIDVLKDASAAAIYGAKAANGVIIISTKKGKYGKPVVNVNTSIGFTQKSAYREVFSAGEYMRYREDWYTTPTFGLNPTTGGYEPYQTGETRVGYYASPDNLGRYGVSLDTWRAYSTNEAGESDKSIWAGRLLSDAGLDEVLVPNYVAGKTFDWYEHTFRTGFNQDYNASVSGANEKMSYYLSAGYMKNQGAVVGNEYNTVRANMKVDGKVSKWLEISANVNFQDRSDGDIQPDLGTDYWINNQLRNSPYSNYKDDKGNLAQYPAGPGTTASGYNFDFDRQFLELEKGYTVLNSIFSAKVTLPFNITYSFNAAPRYQFFYDRYFMSAALPNSDPTTRGVNREQAKRFDWSLNNTISWDYTFADKHHVMLTLVQEAENRQYWQDRIQSRNILPSDALGFHYTQVNDNSTFSTNDTHQSADALLARLFYSYDDRYMLTASIRRDGYSAFGQSNPYATFPSVAAAWTFTSEDFWQWKNIMSTGKLRVSYGKNGNRSLNDPYVSLANLGAGEGKTMGYVVGNGTEQVKYLLVDRLANPNLQWEKTASWNFALDYGFLNDRIYGSIEYYNMATTDMIMSQRLPNFTGFSSITTNLGEVTNKGLEISVASLNIKSDVLEWRTQVGFSYNKNEIKHLYYQNEDVLDVNGNVIGSKEMDDVSNSWFIGQPIGVIWNYEVTGIWQVAEAEEAAKYGQYPGDPKVANHYTADDKVNADGTVTPVYNDKDKVFLGQTTAPIRWSMRNEFTLWKSLSISFNLYSYMGHKSLSTLYLNNDNAGSMIQKGLNTFKKEYWMPDNPTNDYARLDAKGPAGALSPGKLYNRSFVRLENVSIGYTLPKKWTSVINFESAKIFGNIRNVAVWNADWEYGDPETGGLATRVYTLGLSLTF